MKLSLIAVFIMLLGFGLRATAQDYRVIDSSFPSEGRNDFRVEDVLDADNHVFRSGDAEIASLERALLRSPDPENRVRISCRVYGLSDYVRHISIRQITAVVKPTDREQDEYDVRVPDIQVEDRDYNEESRYANRALFRAAAAAMCRSLSRAIAWHEQYNCAEGERSIQAREDIGYREEPPYYRQREVRVNIDLGALFHRRRNNRDPATRRLTGKRMLFPGRRR